MGQYRAGLSFPYLPLIFASLQWAFAPIPCHQTHSTDSDRNSLDKKYSGVGAYQSGVNLHLASVAVKNKTDLFNAFGIINHSLPFPSPPPRSIKLWRSRYSLERWKLSRLRLIYAFFGC